MSARPLLLDLFCCAGGAATGYHRAGFDVLGVDIDPQPRYPFKFVQADALALLTFLAEGGYIPGTDLWLDDFAAIHASPPCQGYSVTKSTNSRVADYPMIIPEVRELLKRSGKPYVIENVEGAKAVMVNPVKLCGSHFKLETIWEGYGRVGLRRHRLFECNFPVADLGPHDHSLRSTPVYGHGPGGVRTHKLWPVRLGGQQAAREVMGIDWTTRRELDEAIPPAYTEYIGKQLLTALQGVSNASGQTSETS